MIKEKNEETGEVKVIFSSEEFKRLKIFGGAAAVLLILSAGLAGWAAYSTTALHAENELYRSQLKMADEKMQALENKAKTVEKISGQLQELVRTNGGTVPENTGTGGIGGAFLSKVPPAFPKQQFSHHLFSYCPSFLLCQEQWKRRQYRQSLYFQARFRHSYEQAPAVVR